MPVTNHATPSDAQSALVNALKNAGYTQNSALGVPLDVLCSAVANLLTSTFGSIRVYTASLSPAQVNANTAAEQTFTVTGVEAGDVILVNKPTAQAGLIVGQARASAANQVGITFGNFTGAGITPTAAQTYTFVAIRP